MKAVWIVLGVLLLGGVWFGGSVVSSRNTLVTQGEDIKRSWADVDIALQRRADLIPNLVNTVKGFASHEKEILESLANARASMAGARTPQEKIQANSSLDSALSRLLVVVENYPQLKANENFMRLQDELAGTENRIAVERRKYNETVQAYNKTIGLFPSNIAASLFGYQRNDDYFKSEPASRTAPKVAF
jgi:LemA protein